MVTNILNKDVEYLEKDNISETFEELFAARNVCCPQQNSCVPCKTFPYANRKWSTVPLYQKKKINFKKIIYQWNLWF